MCLLIGIPSCIGLIMCAEPLIATLFQYRRFGAEDTRMTSLSVMAQSIAVPAFLLVKVLAPAFYSRQDTRTPVKAAVVSVIANLLFTLLLFAGLLAFTDAGRAALALTGGRWFAALEHLPGAHALLALAIALAGWLNALQLWWYLRRESVYAIQPGWGRFLRQVGLASVAMIAVLAVLLTQWHDWTPWAWWQRALRLAALVGAGGAVYAGLLLVQGIRPRDLRGH